MFSVERRSLYRLIVVKRRFSLVAALFSFLSFCFPFLLLLVRSVCCLFRVAKNDMVSHAIMLVKHLVWDSDAILECRFTVFVIFVFGFVFAI